MKTNVYILFNGAAMEYMFDVQLEEFMKRWNDHLHGIGYFSGYDETGQCVVINPSNCGVVQIRGIERA